MTDATTRIKNLSIALARLSRKNRNVNIADRVYSLLSHEIAKEEEKAARETARPANAATIDPSF